MKRGGKPSHNFWGAGGFKKHYEMPGRKLVAICLSCNKIISNTAISRLQSHRRICNKPIFQVSSDEAHDPLMDENTLMLDVEVSNETMDLTNSFVVPVKNLTTDADEASSLSTSMIQVKTAQVKKRKFDKRLSQFVDSISQKEQKQLNILLSKLFYSCNIPLQVVESSHFTNLFKAMRPSYQVPKVSDLSTVLLNDLHEQMKESNTFPSSQGILIIKKVKKELSYQFMAFIHMQDNSLIYLTTMKVARNFDWNQIILDAKQLVDAKGISIYAVMINDNIDLIDKASFEKLWLLRCNWSFSVLIEKKLIPLDVINQAQSLLEAFSSPEMSQKLIKNRGSAFDAAKDKVNCQNWYLLSTCLENLTAMSNMLADRTVRLDTKVVETLIDPKFEEKLQYNTNLLTPIVSIIEKSEKQSTIMADVIEKWLILAASSQYDPIHTKINTIMTPAALTANLLHPSYRGKNFIKELHHDIITIEFLMEEVGQSGVEDFICYRDLKSIFENARLQEFSNPFSYWKIVKKVHPILSDLALKLLQIPAAAVPKLESFNNNIQTHLTPKRLEKLEEMFYTLNF